MENEKEIDMEKVLSQLKEIKKGIERLENQFGSSEIKPKITVEQMMDLVFYISQDAILAFCEQEGIDTTNIEISPITAEMDKNGIFEQCGIEIIEG